MPQTFRPRPSRRNRQPGKSPSWTGSSSGDRNESQRGLSNGIGERGTTRGWFSTPPGTRRTWPGRWVPGPFSWRVRTLFAFLIVIVSLTTIVDVRVRPSIAAIAESVTRRAATEALNEALQGTMVDRQNEGDILHVETDSSGNVRLATFDFHLVSVIQAEATERSEVTLRELARQTFSLPISQTVGGPLFSVFTPELPVRINLVGSAHSSIRMDVQSVGINQSVHALYLDMTATVQAVAPLVTKPVEIHTSVPLAYVVLNGEIPSTYVGKATPDVPVLPPIGDK